MNIVSIANDLQQLREQHELKRREAIEQFVNGRDAARLTRRLSACADQALSELWQRSELQDEATLLAVGGFGRAELFPFSDVDLLVLVPESAAPETLKSLEQFVTNCWDVGMAIGHSVRTVNQCLQEQRHDVTVQTALLDRRLLNGDPALAEQLGTALADSMSPERFLRAKSQEMRQRHNRYEDTPYSLEPNTKESPGGLRDLHTLAWVAKAAGMGTNWQQLRSNGLLTAAEAHLIRHNERLLRRIRAALHVCANRGEDRLVFDLQGTVADMLGYSDQPQRRASEQLMQRYYRAAKTITQMTTIIMQNIDEHLGSAEPAEPVPLDEEFQSRDRLLEPIDPQLFETNPAAILRAFLQLQRHPSLRGMSTPALRAMWNARTRIDAAFRRDPDNRRLFIQIFKEPRGITHALRWMNRWSILGHYLPVFRRIVGRMQHDLFHVYTVDQHIMTVLRNLRRFDIVEHAHEYPLCSQLMNTVDEPYLLYVAAIFHDIAKGRGGDHSELGAKDARQFCEQHFVDEAGTELVVFLVEHHLTMSTVAQKQDISDPAVIGKFAGIVQTEERLVALYLLTVADIRGTSPKVWNGWKAKLLEDLYRTTRQFLLGNNPAPTQRMGVRRREAIRLLDLSTVAPASYEEFWNSLEISYFLRTDPTDIAWHARVLGKHCNSDEPIVRTRVSPFGEGFQVVVYTPDQEDLFARICGYFDSSNLSVIDAKIHTTDSGRALDSFLVSDPYANGNYRDRLALVELQLTKCLTGPRELPTPMNTRSSRRSRMFPVKASVEIRADEAHKRFLLSIIANDRTGLLYSVAGVLARHGINVYAARVMTLGERAEDTFLIDGEVLSNPRQILELETEVLEAVKLPR